MNKEIEKITYGVDYEDLDTLVVFVKTTTGQVFKADYCLITLLNVKKDMKQVINEDFNFETDTYWDEVVFDDYFIMMDDGSIGTRSAYDDYGFLDTLEIDPKKLST